MVHVIEGSGDDYEIDSYHNFGDVDEYEHMSADTSNYREHTQQLSASSTSSQKPLFLIKSSEYLSGYKERVLGE